MFFKSLVFQKQHTATKCLKQEMYYGEELVSYKELKIRIEEYIYWYNHERSKGKLAGLSPVEYRTQSSQSAA
ncbi:IS3 family transposase [Gracilibacillus alcaliphilus]|uniref:IS3 family transposase n=1 Tax=Gracilibacillus alcaliphilus TaxID=1401441 RepID=UPI001958DED8|nr:transposase InsO family protein [Gracilibacillus alcaliphilus]